MKNPYYPENIFTDKNNERITEIPIKSQSTPQEKNNNTQSPNTSSQNQMLNLLMPLLLQNKNLKDFLPFLTNAPTPESFSTLLNAIQKQNTQNKKEENQNINFSPQKYIDEY